MNSGRSAHPFPVLALIALLSTIGCDGGDESTPAPTEIEASFEESGGQIGTEPADAEADVDPEADPSEEPDTGNEDAAEVGGPLTQIGVRIYFPAAGGDGLVSEGREIFKTAEPGDRIKQIVTDLIDGPSGDRAVRAVPSGLRLRQAYVLADGTAYLDFTAELLDGAGGGSMRELLTVYAIVDSVALNVAEVQRVGILVNGRPIETLNGHLDLRRPLKPDRKLILDSRSARLRGAATARG